MGIALSVSLGRVCVRMSCVAAISHATAQPQFARPSDPGATLNALPSLKLTLIDAFVAL